MRAMTVCGQVIVRILDSGQSTRDTRRGRTGERAKNENKEKKLNPCYTEIQTRASQS